MNDKWNRREVLKGMAVVSSALALPGKSMAATSFLSPAAADTEIQISSISPHTVRLTVLPMKNDKAALIPFNGSLVQESWGKPVATLRGDAAAPTVKRSKRICAIGSAGAARKR